MSDEPDKNWQKSSYSANSDCIEVCFQDGLVGIRDSKDRLGGVLTFTLSEWRAFLSGARDGEFDPS